jgi:P2-related tail formation protein
LWKFIDVATGSKHTCRSTLKSVRDVLDELIFDFSVIDSDDVKGGAASNKRAKDNFFMEN